MPAKEQFSFGRERRQRPRNAPASQPAETKSQEPKPAEANGTAVEPPAERKTA